MKFCTYCKLFRNEINEIIREDHVIEKYDKHEPIRHLFEQETYRYACEYCGSIYEGIP